MYIYIYILIFFILYVYINISCAFILFIAIRPLATPTFPSTSPFYHLVSKISETRPQIFICTTKMNELGLRRSLNDDTRDPSLYAFHFSHLIPHITCTCEKSRKLVKDPCRIRTRRKTHFKLYVIESFAYYETKLKILI